MKNINQTWFTT